MSTKPATTTILILIALAFAAGLVLYPRMPDPMPSHWNTAGEVDGYMPRFWGLFLMPLVLVGIFLLYLAIPRIDPLKANIAAFIREYNLMMVVLAFFMFYVYALTLLWALGFEFNMNLMIFPAMGVLLITIGFLIGNARRNYFVGIRTPWTLSSDSVWARTHRLGKWMFMAAGALTLLATFVYEAGFWLFMGATLLAALVPVIYSYFAWKNEQ